MFTRICFQIKFLFLILFIWKIKQNQIIIYLGTKSRLKKFLYVYVNNIKNTLLFNIYKTNSQKYRVL